MNRDLKRFQNFSQKEGEVGIRNWCGTTILCSENQLLYPRSEEELIFLMRDQKKKFRIVGSGLSYEPLNKLDDLDSSDLCLISLEEMKGVVNEDFQKSESTFYGGTLLDDIFAHLLKQNKMIATSPGVIGIQTLAGSIGTGTHGQGLFVSTLSDTVVKMRVVQADGKVLEIKEGDEDFGAYLMHYGCLGIVTQITLRTVPLEILYCKKINTDFAFLLEDFSEMNEKSKYVKAWWFPETNKVQIWEVNEAREEMRQIYEQNNKEVVQIDATLDDSLNLTVEEIRFKMAIETNDLTFQGEQFKTVDRFKNATHIVGDLYQVYCKGIPKPQINCEIAIPFEKMPEALLSLQKWYKQSQANGKNKPHYPFIIRCNGPSKAYLSGAYQRKTCWIGFLVYLTENGQFIEGSLEMMKELQEILAPFEGVPHLGKHFLKNIFSFNSNLPMWNRFREIRKNVDPQGKFSNKFLNELFSE